MLNLITVILFELVAFTLLDTKADGGGIPDMINKMLALDWMPYSQVMVGDEVSAGLQRSLGMYMSKTPIIWIE